MPAISLLEWLFFLGIGVVFYAYLGYGILLYIILKIRGKKRAELPVPAAENLPEITFVVCAFNEAEWMHEKIANSLALDYPRDKVHFYFVTDGSDDATPDMVRQYPYPDNVSWQLLHQPERRGKIAAFHRAMEQVRTPIVVSTDANTRINREALLQMARHFQDPQTCAVAGEKRIAMAEKDSASSAGEGIYWKYESTLKRWDAELWSVVGAAGELFAIRSDLYEPVPPDTIVEDFYMTMRMAQRGYRVAYEPEAYAVERSSANVQEELKRKVRIAAGSWQAVTRLAPLLNIFRYGTLSFEYISHRVLRWTLAPAFLPVLLFVNGVLAIEKGGFYLVTMLLQVLFYAAALLGYLLEQRQLKVKILFVPYYFCVMNYAQYAGFFRFMRKKQSVVWERAKRAGEN